ncbi:MAG: group II truncated hemoglobin [Pseudomonadota bacterium]|nr:group II truncated hemoglobin [Pseudomonadota bacterium]MDP1903121.1 group II truncated hemoglobin [Pseudomonadota bacterium]MDP2351131.1 group II truncated hemoglobin [Pseudomonadota bacterium]
MTLQSHYERIGGEPKVRQLVDRFYDHMDELPETYGIRKLHAEDLTGSRQKLYDFLTGWLGGPQLYVEKHGHPMLRRRHISFPIGNAERDQWMHCMRLALDEVVEDAKLRAELHQAFVKVADHMRNQAQHSHPH